MNPWQHAERFIQGGFCKMRVYEGILIAVTIAALIGSLFIFKKSRWMLRTSAGLAALLFAVHALVEGLRWPMLPAYAAVALLLWIELRQELVHPKINKQRKSRSDSQAAESTSLMHRSRTKHATTKRTTISRVLSGAAILVYAAFSIALPVLFPIFSFDTPKGPYGIGTVSYAWTDEAREETFAAGKGSPRQLRVQVWYPADPNAQGTASTYVPDAQVYAQAFHDILGLPKLLFISLKDVRTHAIESASLSAKEFAYPVLIFSHGLHGYESQNMFQVEQLVSEGYIVVGINHTYSSLASVFPDGQVALFDSQGKQGFEELQFDFMDNLNTIWVKDVQFVLDRLERLNADDADQRFTGHLDMQRIGMFGHSFGGATTVQMLLNDPRIQAGINMDGVLFGEDRIPAEGVGKPFMMMSADSTLAGADAMSDEQIAAMGATRSEAEDYYEEVYARYEPVTAGGNTWVTLDDALHLSFSDLFLMSPLLEWTQGVDARGTQRLVNALTLDFFDHYLKGRPLNILNQPAGQYEGYTLQRES